MKLNIALILLSALALSCTSSERGDSTESQHEGPPYVDRWHIDHLAGHLTSTEKGISFVV